MEPGSRGDPESPLRWTCKSTRKLAAQLTEMGHQIGPSLVRRLLHEMGYSLQANRKVLEGSSHPDRNEQFEHINATSIEHLAAGEPVISVDTSSAPGGSGPQRKRDPWVPSSDSKSRAGLGRGPRDRVWNR